MSSQDRPTRRLLEEVEADTGASQRSLSKSLGIALGLTNLLLRRLIRKGCIRVIRIKRNRVRYLITPTGIAEKARMTRNYLESTVAFYADARDRIRDSFGVLSSTWDTGASNSDHHHGPSHDKRIVFYGAGEVAEIGYICLQGTDLRLVGVVDDERTRPFFGIPVHPPSRLAAGTLDGQPFECLVVMSFGDRRRMSPKLHGLDLPPAEVFWI
jgi:hypothetical protein